MLYIFSLKDALSSHMFLQTNMSSNFVTFQTIVLVALLGICANPLKSQLQWVANSVLSSQQSKGRNFNQFSCKITPLAEDPFKVKNWLWLLLLIRAIPSFNSGKQGPILMGFSVQDLQLLSLSHTWDKTSDSLQNTNPSTSGASPREDANLAG